MYKNTYKRISDMYTKSNKYNSKKTFFQRKIKIYNNFDNIDKNPINKEICTKCGWEANGPKCPSINCDSVMCSYFKL
jgi:hypothetical protein